MTEIEGAANPWRPAVIRAMRSAADEEARLDWGGDKPAFNYRWEHISTVVQLALKLADLVGADEEIVEAAAWLHDVTKQDGELHAQTGADFARQVLAETDFPSQKIELVAQAILEHIGLWREEPLTRLESMVLWDADKLSKVGLTAAIHWTGMALTQGKPVTTADLVDKLKQQQWQADTVASMHTEPARRAAQERWDSYDRLWKTLERELNGEDLV